jgi:hypothetical protein
LPFDIDLLEKAAAGSSSTHTWRSIDVNVKSARALDLVRLRRQCSAVENAAINKLRRPAKLILARRELSLERTLVAAKARELSRPWVKSLELPVSPVGT